MKYDIYAFLHNTYLPRHHEMIDIITNMILVEKLYPTLGVKIRNLKVNFKTGST